MILLSALVEIWVLGIQDDLHRHNYASLKIKIPLYILVCYLNEQFPIAVMNWPLQSVEFTPLDVYQLGYMKKMMSETRSTEQRKHFVI